MAIESSYTVKTISLNLRLFDDPGELAKRGNGPNIHGVSDQQSVGRVPVVSLKAVNTIGNYSK